MSICFDSKKAVSCERKKGEKSVGDYTCLDSAGSEGTHTQKSLTHQRATARSIASTEITTDDSGTDTTCYSVRHIPVTVHRTHDGTSVSGDRPRTSMEKGRNASLNGMQSPATAWKRSQQQQVLSSTQFYSVCIFLGSIIIDLLQGHINDLQLEITHEIRVIFRKM